MQFLDDMRGSSSLYFDKGMHLFTQIVFSVNVTSNIIPDYALSATDEIQTQAGLPLTKGDCIPSRELPPGSWPSAGVAGTPTAHCQGVIYPKQVTIRG